jgi:DNA-binding NarL/FixJ family response regulator
MDGAMVSFQNLSPVRSNRGMVRGAVEQLTRRETEIAQLVARGHTNKEIARQLFLSVRTVETHVDRILGKLDFHTRSRLAAWVTQLQLSAGLSSHGLPGLDLERLQMTT